MVRGGGEKRQKSVVISHRTDANATRSWSRDQFDAAYDAGSCPKPPPMRKKPQQRWIGPGKRYATRAQFDADLAKWVEEHEARKLLVKKWDKQQEKL